MYWVNYYYDVEESDYFGRYFVFDWFMFMWFDVCDCIYGYVVGYLFVVLCEVWCLRVWLYYGICIEVVLRDGVFYVYVIYWVV